jgi:hypothetical protein
LVLKSFIIHWHYPGFESSNSMPAADVPIHSSHRIEDLGPLFQGSFEDDIICQDCLLIVYHKAVSQLGFRIGNSTDPVYVGGFKIDHACGINNDCLAIISCE